MLWHSTSSYKGLSQRITRCAKGLLRPTNVGGSSCRSRRPCAGQPYLLVRSRLRHQGCGLQTCLYLGHRGLHVGNGQAVGRRDGLDAEQAVRSAIGDSGEGQRLIKTLPRKGFRFVGRVQEEQGPGPISQLLTAVRGRFCCKSPLPLTPNNDSVCAPYGAAGACHDGTAEERAGSAVLFFLP
jgi:hypothetical protein